MKLHDLNQAIEYSQNACNLTPEGNFSRAAYLLNLIQGLAMRYEKEEKSDDLNQAIVKAKTLLV